MDLQKNTLMSKEMVKDEYVIQYHGKYQCCIVIYEKYISMNVCIIKHTSYG